MWGRPYTHYRYRTSKYLRVVVRKGVCLRPCHSLFVAILATSRTFDGQLRSIFTLVRHPASARQTTLGHFFMMAVRATFAFRSTCQITTVNDALGTTCRIGHAPCVEFGDVVGFMLLLDVERHILT